MTIAFDTAASRVEERLGEAAFQHCLRVAETACSLAGIYGVDPEEARLAGLLHDWDREVSNEALVETAIADGHAMTEADAHSPRLLHAQTGAAALREEFPGISDSVVGAVARHTLGAVDMQPLDMVVYVADMIEPARTYPGIDDVREAVGTLSLDAAFAEAYRYSMAALVKARKPIHPLTVDVWNAYVARGRT